MELQNIRRIGVFKLQNIGDVLMITPVLRALRETFPEARITVVVSAVTEAMLANNPHVDEVLTPRRKDKSRGVLHRVANELGFVRELRKRRFDLTIGFTNGDRTRWYSGLCRARHRFGVIRTLEPERLAYNHSLFNPRNVSVHEVEKHFALLKSADFPLKSYEPGPLCLVVPEDLRKWAREQLAPLRPHKIVHVHPVSRWLWKCWGSDSMAQVIDWLQTERDARVVLTTGPVPQELQRAREIAALCKTKPLFFEGNLSLEQIAALSAESDGYFGVDTAPMHMAAAVGVPVVALFGPTNSRNWSPWRARGEVLSKHCPCNDPQAKEKCDWTQVRACLAAITVPEAEAALERMLALPKVVPNAA